MWHSNIVKV